MRPLERQADVDEGANSLHAVVVLSMVEEIALAALVRGVPVENVKVRLRRCVWSRRRASRGSAAARESSTACLKGWISRGEVGGESG